MPSTITVAGRPIGAGHAPLVIAEVAQAHDGSLGAAHAFVDLAADCGADAVKFQTHIAAAESTYDEPFRVRFTEQDATRYDYWRRMEFSPTAWRELAAHAAERGLIFLSSPFSMAAVELLRELGVPAWKVGSGEFRSRDLIGAMRETGLPILLSTGMCTWAEVDAIVQEVGAGGYPIAVFQCTSRYPTPTEQVGLNCLDEFRARYGVPVGLSDHSGAPWAAIAAIARGADLIEVHLTFHRACFGPDVPASLTPDQLHELCSARDAISAMLANPVDKDGIAADLQAMRETFGKSLALVEDRPRGHLLAAGDLTTKKPATGIAPQRIDEVLGRRLVRDVPADRLLREEDLG